ncbi:MAG: PilT/PilU family type 4a pilus ATPase [Acidobacteriota bacterium]
MNQPLTDPPSEPNPVLMPKPVQQQSATQRPPHPQVQQGTQQPQQRPPAQPTNGSPILTTEMFHRILGHMLAVDPKVSDLIFSPGRPPQVELTSDLFGVTTTGIDKLTPALIKAIADLMLMGNKTGQETLEKTGSSDISYSAPAMARFRVNIFRQRGTHAIVMRVIPGRVPNWQELDLPMAVRNVSDLKNGLVLVTGPTGSGKSTTLAAVIDLINSTKKYHVVTIEDPIEFLHEHKLSTIHQRELHSDTPDFALALRAALRQAPKVILVGEMRDRETIEVAMEAAETGHLVLSTLHTIDAAKTIDRIIGVFPKNEEPVIRTRLSQSFRRIVSQRLIPKIGGGRTAAIEILVSNSRTREYIEKGEREGRSMYDAMKDGAIDGMQTFDLELEKMIRNGTITRDNGILYASNANNLILSISDLDGPPAAKPAEPAAVTDAGPARKDVPVGIEGFEP